MLGIVGLRALVRDFFQKVSGGSHTRYIARGIDRIGHSRHYYGAIRISGTEEECSKVLLWHKCFFAVGRDARENRWGVYFGVASVWERCELIAGVEIARVSYERTVRPTGLAPPESWRCS